MNLNQTKVLLLLSLLATAACAKDKAKDDEEKPAATQTPQEYRARQQAFADSVLNASSSTKTVVEKLGKGYEVGSVKMRDSVATLAADTTAHCFKVGRATDPYLAGTVSFWVNMNVTGSDIIRIQKSEWTSTAGNIVDACLNQLAKKWTFDTAIAKPGAYIVQVQFK